MFSHLTLLKVPLINVFSLFLLDSQTLAGEEKTCSYQRQSQSFEKPDSPSGWQRQRTLLQTGES